MQKFRWNRILASALALIMLLTTLPSLTLATSSDVAVINGQTTATIQDTSPGYIYEEFVAAYVPINQPSETAISRGAFVQELVDFFGWPHWDEYNDTWKDDPKTFADIGNPTFDFVGGGVSDPTAHTNRRAIETALEEGVVGPLSVLRGGSFHGQRTENGVITQSPLGFVHWGVHVMANNFRPNEVLTRQDAAVMLARAWKLDISDTINPGFDDWATLAISPDYSLAELQGSIVALYNVGLFDVPLGNFYGIAAFTTADGWLSHMQDEVVAPVYFMPRPTWGYSPRRNILLYTANPAAEIYVSRNLNGQLNTALGGIIEPGPVVIDAQSRFHEFHNTGNDSARGFLGYDIGGTVNFRQYPIIRAIAVDHSKTVYQAPGQESRGEWNLWRPPTWDFNSELIFARNELGPGSPLVYRIFNRSDGVLAMAFYIEGTERAIVWDALNLNRANTMAGNHVNLRNYVVSNLAGPAIAANASELIDLVISHSDGDHVQQTWSFCGLDAFNISEGIAGHRIFACRRMSATVGGGTLTDRVVTGDEFDLGGIVLTVYEFPGHNNNHIILHDAQFGFLLGSDVLGCTRSGSADDVGISNLRSDAFLSIIQQTWARINAAGPVSYVFTGHDDALLSGPAHMQIFEEVFQLIVDEGELAVSHPTVRQVRRGANGRSVTIGSIYPDSIRGLGPSGVRYMPVPLTQAEANAQLIPGQPTPIMPIPSYREFRAPDNWLTILLGGQFGQAPSNMSSPQAWNTVTVNYNTAGPDAYAVLSNIQFSGADLVGVQFPFGAAAANILEDMFNPWYFNYTIHVLEGTSSIRIYPTSMVSTGATVTVDGTAVAREEGITVPITYDGQIISIVVVSPNGLETESYTFTVELVAAPLAPIIFTGNNPNNLSAYLAERDVILKTAGNLGIFAHHSPFIIPEGRTLTVVTTLNVQGNAELVISGTLLVQNGGRVNNHGGAGGTIRIEPSGLLDNHGHVENVTNSTVINYGAIYNRARFEVRAGTTLHNCGNLDGTLNIHRQANIITCVNCEHPD